MKNLKTIYLIAFIIGSIVPTYFFVSFLNEHSLDPNAFGNAIFATSPAANFSSQLLISCFVFWIFMFVDSKGKKLPNILWFMVLTFAVGLSSSLPLYLYFRERNK
jgi:Terpene cyclase DEP1